MLDILPATLPFDVVSYTNWDGVGSPETASLPSTHRYQFSVSGLNLSQAYSVYLPDVVSNRITLSFKGATTTDQAALDSWRTDGSITSAQPCNVTVNGASRAVQMVPVVRIEGVDQSQASNPPVVTGSLALCPSGPGYSLRLAVSLAENSIGEINAAQYSNINPANLHALQGYAFQASDALLAQRAAQLTAQVNSTANPNASANTLDATEGEFLHLVGLKYMRYVTDAIKQIGDLDGSTGQSGNHIGLASSQIKVQYVFDLPYGVSRAGFLVDMPGMLSRSTDLVTGKLNGNDYLMSGYAGSALESYVWQENAKLDAVSAVRGLQFARETGIGVVVLNSANWSSVRPTLNVHPAGNPPNYGDCSYSGTQYPICFVDSTGNANSIISYVNQGYTVTMPKSMVAYSSDWTGPIFVAIRDNTATGGNFDALFNIQKYNGGWTAGAPINSGSYTITAPYSYVPPPASVAPVYLSQLPSVIPSSNVIVDSAPTALLPASNGITSASIFSGDPVNLVTGNLYHNETDIRIKGRGGFPIVFERSYNSRNPGDGPLGYGWTHSFNAKLKFYGVESGQAKFSWIDGSGAEKFFAAPSGSHTNGNINLGATIASPTGVFVTFQRLADGTYSIKEKNGLTYKFASATGPSGVPGPSTTPVFAALQSITDRNGNSMTLSYTAATGCAGGTLLCTVMDSVGHTLSFTYSGIHITQIKDFTGRLFQYGYADGNNNLTSFSNPLAVAGKQNALSYSYYTSADGTSLPHLMKQYTLPRGNGMKFEYYANGRVFRHTVVRIDGTSSPDQINLFTYNDFRRETVQTNERLGDKHFFFDPYGNPLKVVEENGAEHSYSYDCIDQTQAPGSANCLNPYNRLSETNPAGFITQYAYDSNGNVTQITPPRGTAAATQYLYYNGFGRPRLVQDGNGNYAIQRFDTNGNLTDAIRVASSYTPPSCAASECAIPDASLILSWTVNGYDSTGNLTSTKRVRDVAGQITNNTATSNTGPLVTYGFDTNKWNATSISRVGIKNADTSASTVNTATLGYDSLGRLTSGVDADWYSTQFKYDDLDRPYQATDRLGQLRTYQFDANGNTVGQSLTISTAGVSTLVDSSSSRYDDSDRVIQSLDAGGFATAFTYDAAGNVLTITNPDGYVVSFDYDAANRPIHAYDQANNAVTTKRDTSGRTRSVTDPNGNTVTYSYWDATRDGRLKSVTYPLITNNGNGAALTSGRSIQYDYDAVGNVTSVTEVPAAGSGQANRVTTTSYDELNRPVRIVGPAHLIIDFSGPWPYGLMSACEIQTNLYDTLGRTHIVFTGYTPAPCDDPTADVVNTLEGYNYDDFGRKTLSANDAGQSWVYTYDSNNNLQTVLDPKSQTTSYTWDRGHQLLTRTEQGGRLTTYTRNALGQVLTVSHPEVNYGYSYDAAHRLLSVSDSRGRQALNYDWSPGGLLNSLRDSSGRLTSYLYDPVGRLTGITAPNGDSISMQLDAGGRIVQRTLPHGVATRYVYNEDNSLHRLTNLVGTGTVFSQHDYAYDGVGNRVKYAGSWPQNSQSVQMTYDYDEVKRLTGTSDGTATGVKYYDYDGWGNLTEFEDHTTNLTTGYTYQGLSQLSSFFVTKLDIYNTFVSRTYVSNDANGNRTSDGRYKYTWDALNQLTSVQSLAQPATTLATFTYDSEGRRIKKVAGGVTTQWLYDGEMQYAEYGSDPTSPSGVYTNAGEDQPLMAATVTGASTYGAVSYFHADGLGNIVGASTSTGGNVTSLAQQFDEWGNSQGTELAQQGVAHAPFGYTGREDDGLGLVYLRARSYDPVTMRFLSRDPAGLRGGANAHVYCDDNPTNCTDPSGMLPSFANTIAQNQASNYFPSLSISGDGFSSGFQSLATTESSAERISVSDQIAGLQRWQENGNPILDQDTSTMALATNVLGFATSGGLAKALIGGTAKLATIGLAALVGEEAGSVSSAVQSVGKYSVGPYNEIRGTVAGMDAHHVGQRALMQDLIPGYDANTAPAILVPKVGHTIKGPNGIVSRSVDGLSTPRDVLARDIRELRRVYPDVPNSSLQDLIQMNKDAYPGAFGR